MCRQSVRARARLGDTGANGVTHRRLASILHRVSSAATASSQQPGPELEPEPEQEPSVTATATRADGLQRIVMCDRSLRSLPQLESREKPHPRSVMPCSPLHRRFSFSWNLTLHDGSGYLEPKMLLSECDKFALFMKEKHKGWARRVLWEAGARRPAILFSRAGTATPPLLD